MMDLESWDNGNVERWRTLSVSWKDYKEIAQHRGKLETFLKGFELLTPWWKCSVVSVTVSVPKHVWEIRVVVRPRHSLPA
ncbi:UNVERIFIED_CONTAM: hypothetical protein FKN15_047663 [Acipenser sinensis]